MNKPSNSPFLDSKGLLALVLIGVFFAFWQWYMAKTYPPKTPAKTAEVQQVQTAAQTEAAAPSATETKTTQVQAAEKTFLYSGNKLRFVISNIGMGLKNVVLTNFTDRSGNPVKMGESETMSLFEMRWNKTGNPVVFKIEEKTKGHYVGRAESEGVKLVRELKYDELRQAFESTVELQNAREDMAVEILVPERISQPESGSFLFPSYDHQDFFVIQDNKDEETVNFSSAKSDVRQEIAAAHLVSVSSQYFATAVLDQSDLTPELRLFADIGKKEASARVIYKPVQAGNLKLIQTFFVGPKSVDVLDKIHPDLAQIINFGSLSFIAKPMLLIMKMSHEWISNWGIAIIILTLIVRFAVFPLYLMSTKSMKAMQRVQPLIQALKEKYKDDPMRMNQEMMAIMREHKANPLGGCLPMLLQIPIFFALFRVIGSSVELYQAPFAGWIKDLSLHDPYFVLPALMGITMYIQQKMTPTAMDPAQAKILAMMPLIFTVFMIYLPSGLTLYMFVSAVFGILQQKLMMRDTAPVAAVKKS